VVGPQQPAGGAGVQGLNLIDVAHHLAESSSPDATNRGVRDYQQATAVAGL
jgi:hypothetical protein